MGYFDKEFCNFATKRVFVRDIIQLMPDQLANQIAAGEVIQRPASAAKELLENSLDSGATEIQLIIEDSGKKLIQVVDNGSGMSVMDARMSFERHATSKIKSIDDLFSIKTMGFRGEALASIAAVAQVELRTRREEDELGTLLLIESGEVKKQEPISCPVGTSLAIRNLFYNLPARRKFLKSNTTEYKHILEEFTRIGMAFPEISFLLYHNKTEQFNLRKGKLKNRVIDLLGNRFEKNLIPVSEDTDLLQIQGYIGKPAAATHARGNQFFFVNRRYIRSPYLNHAVKTAFDGLIDKESNPLYTLQLDLNTDRVDVNVHPSKQEVKFEDERILYAYIHAAVKHALAKFNISPSIDFTLNPEIQNTDALRLPVSEETNARAQSGFLAHSFSEQGQAHFLNTRLERKEWEQQRDTFFPEIASQERNSALYPQNEELQGGPSDSFPSEARKEKPFNILEWRGYLITTVKSGIMLVHKRRALERIIYENLQERVKHGAPPSQQLLFPYEIELPPSEMVLVEEAKPFLKTIGFSLKKEKKDSLTVTGLPVGVTEEMGKHILMGLIEQLQISPLALQDPFKKNLLIKMAQEMAQGNAQNSMMDASLIDELFACKEPGKSPGGKPVFTILTEEKLISVINN